MESIAKGWVNKKTKVWGCWGCMGGMGVLGREHDH